MTLKICRDHADNHSEAAYQPKLISNRVFELIMSPVNGDPLPAPMGDGGYYDHKAIGLPATDSPLVDVIDLFHNNL